MKHIWQQLRAPWKDKTADSIPGQPRMVFQCKGYDLNTERYITRPGVFQCSKCGHIFQGNYPPPESWETLNIIPNCLAETLRQVHES